MDYELAWNINWNEIEILFVYLLLLLLILLEVEGKVSFVLAREIMV